MAWSWSHTNEAYAAAKRNLRALDRETLETIYAEWIACDPLAPDSGDGEPFSQSLYDATIADLAARNVPLATLADSIWRRANDLATCDNGGFNAWMCPYGCGPHTVAFDREDET